MKSLRFTVDVTVVEDDMSYHGTAIDFEKALVGAVGDIPMVFVYKVTDEHGDTYYDNRDGWFFGPAAQEAVRIEAALNAQHVELEKAQEIK